MFEDFVTSLAFLHCNGVVKMMQPTRHKDSEAIEMVSDTLFPLHYFNTSQFHSCTEDSSQ